MHILKNLRKVIYRTDYGLQDRWMHRRLKKLNQADADLAKEEQIQQSRMLRYCRKAYGKEYW